MSDETLSQAAIDALLSGNASSAEAAPAVPEPAPEPGPAPLPETEPVPVAAAPAPKLPRESALPPVVEASLPSEAMDALTKRVQHIEASLKRIDALEKAAQSTAAMPSDILGRIEAVERSVFTICQLQQEVSADPMLAKIPQLERELANINTMIQTLSHQLKIALGQWQETTRQINDIRQGLQGTLGYEIQQNFECQRCGSRGYVLGLVKCSDCGEEDWWGWWPPEYKEEYPESVGAFATEEEDWWDPDDYDQ